uniref:Protein aurora borealis n=1 Tax=Ascaris lumbricoides TaxID=6252 RepID=A0A0M3HRH5_ASCLU
MSLLSVSTCSQFSLTPTLPDDSECLTPTYTDILSKMSTAHTRAHEKRPFFRRPYYLPSDKDCSTAAFSAYDNRDLTLVEESSEADRLFASGDYLGSPLSKSLESGMQTANSSLTFSEYYDPIEGESSSLRSLGNSKPAIRTGDGYVFPMWSWSRPPVGTSPSDLSVKSMLVKMRTLKDPPSFYELRDMNQGPVDDAPRVTHIPSQYELDDLKDFALFNSVATAERTKPV